MPSICSEKKQRLEETHSEYWKSASTHIHVHVHIVFNRLDTSPLYFLINFHFSTDFTLTRPFLDSSLDSRSLERIHHPKDPLNSRRAGFRHQQS